MLNKTDSPKRK